MAVRRIDLVVAHAVVAVHAQALGKLALLLHRKENVGLERRDVRSAAGATLADRLTWAPRMSVGVLLSRFRPRASAGK